VTAIQKSGQSASDWLRQAVRSRLESERQTGATANAEEKQLEALKQNGADLRREIVKLQQSDAIAQAAWLDLRKTLAAVQQNQVELRHFLERIDAGFGHAFNALGQSLLVALSQQLDRYIQKLTAREDETPPFVLPPIPPRTRL
jgi:hypothetical protein